MITLKGLYPGIEDYVFYGECDCGGRLELSCSDAQQDVFECEDCDKHYVKASPDSKLEYAVHCCMCHKLWPRKTAHLLYENDAYGHFLGDCCWDERLRD